MPMAAIPAAMSPGWAFRPAVGLLHLGPQLFLGDARGLFRRRLAAAHVDRVAEGDLDAHRLGKRAREQPLRAGDRGGDQRSARLEREAPGAALRRSEPLRVAHPGALREEREQAALAQDRARRLERVLVGLAPADRERAEAHEQAAGGLRAKSSLLPMNRRCRGVATATKNESKKLLWLGAITAAPFSGTFSSPVIRNRNHRRMNGTTMRRTTKYSGRDTPFSRASRCACSLVTRRPYPASSAPAGRSPRWRSARWRSCALAAPLRAARPGRSPRPARARVEVGDDDHEPPQRRRARRRRARAGRPPRGSPRPCGRTPAAHRSGFRRRAFAAGRSRPRRARRACAGGRASSTTTWSTRIAPFGCSRPAAGVQAGWIGPPVVPTPSMSPSPSPASVHPARPAPDAPKRIFVVPTRVAAPSTAKPSSSQIAGGSPTASSTSAGLTNAASARGPVRRAGSASGPRPR